MNESLTNNIFNKMDRNTVALVMYSFTSLIILFFIFLWMIFYIKKLIYSSKKLLVNRVHICNNECNSVLNFEYSNIDILDIECSICLDLISPDEKITKFSKCLHIFHESCIHEILLNSVNISLKCPNCRQRVCMTDNCQELVNV
jgi:hypothetical protein